MNKFENKGVRIGPGKWGNMDHSMPYGIQQIQTTATGLSIFTTKYN